MTKTKMIKVDQHEEDTYKYVVLGDKESKGEKLAVAFLTFKEVEKND
jgi:hypothetical protein